MAAMHFEKAGLRHGASAGTLSDPAFRLARGSFHRHTGAGTSGAGKSSMLALVAPAADRPRAKFWRAMHDRAPIETEGEEA